MVAQPDEEGEGACELHHLQVVRDTAMENAYRDNPFPLLELEKYADLAVDFLERLNPAIFIERLFGFAPEAQLIGPLWGKSSAVIRRYIERRLVIRDTYQGRKAVVSRQSSAASDSLSGTGD